MATTIKIGHATHGEGVITGYDSNNNPIYDWANGVDGDQTGKEVLIVDNYSINTKYNIVLRPKTKLLAEKSAKACEDACNNDAIGYSQYATYGRNRNSLYTEAKKVNYDLSKITTPCNTDCSAFMTLCAVAGGASFSYGLDNGSNAPTCDSMKRWFTSKGEYEVLSGSNYTRQTDFLKRGDILVDEDSHTVMVLENGSMILESSSIKVTVSATDVSSTSVLVNVSAIKLEDGSEKSPTESEINLYKWECAVEPLNKSKKAFTSKTLEFSKNGAQLQLTGLIPNSSYILKVIAKELTGEAEVRSANIIFTTLPAYPTAVKKLQIKIDKIIDLNTECKVSFNAPDSWGSGAYTKGYRTYLIINGKSVGYNDTIIQTGKEKVEKTVLLKNITKTAQINHYDVVQIGIQPWLKDVDGDFIFDTSALRCSPPIYNKHVLMIINNIFIKIKDSFKRVILYNKISK